MDRVLFQRLLGAGVVVALGMIVLPFFLQGEGYKAALNTAIPPRPQPPEPLDTAKPEPPSVVRELMEPPPPLAVAPRTELPRSEMLEVKPVPRAAPPPPPVPEVKSVPKPAPVPSQTQGAKTEASKPEGIVSSPAKPAPSKPQGGVWMIQLGSFASEANAQQLQAQVQRTGLPCLIEALEIEGRKVWRVRAGPFANQAEAEAGLKRLQASLKLGGMVMQVR